MSKYVNIEMQAAGSQNGELSQASAVSSEQRPGWTLSKSSRKLIGIATPRMIAMRDVRSFRPARARGGHGPMPCPVSRQDRAGAANILRQQTFRREPRPRQAGFCPGGTSDEASGSRAAAASIGIAALFTRVLHLAKFSALHSTRPLHRS